MAEQSYFHWDLFRPPIHSPSFTMAPSFFDIREEAMRGMPNKAKAFTFDQSCALWSKDIGLDPGEGLHGVGGRVLEIRKEKSRDAARSRRGKENYEFYELAKLLPLPAAITSQLDKASIIRLSISYLKLRDFCGHGDPPWPRDGPSASKSIKGGSRRRSGAGVPVELFELHQGAHILQSLDGFAFSLSNDGRFLYISETVSIYLGLSQVEMAGSSVFDYVHTQDHQELADQLGISLAGISSGGSAPPSPTLDNSPGTPRSITPTLPDRVALMAPNLEKGVDRTFCIRMKSTLTKRGVHTRTSGYRVVLMVGRFRHQVNFGSGLGGGRKGAMPPLLGLAGVAIALPPPTITELRLEADTFIMRLTTQLNVIYCENIISSLTDWRCEELSGRDLYTFCHPGDVHFLKKLHSDLLMKGQVLSPSIRLLNKGGGYIWVQICATSLYNNKTSDDQTILAIFQTISSIEHRGVVMDAGQLDPSSIPPAKHHDAGKRPIFIPSDRTSAQSSPDRSTITTAPSIPMEDDSPPVQSDDTSSLFPDSVENDFLLGDHSQEVAKLDNKISRRKTERPRKRKRESTDEGDVGLSRTDGLTRTDIEHPESHLGATRETRCMPELKCPKIGTGNCPKIGKDTATENAILNLSSTRTQADSPPTDRESLVTSPQLPEDLSFRAIVDSKGDGGTDCDATNTKLSATATNSDGSDIMSSSVKELEKAMSRHLPSRSEGFTGSGSGGGVGGTDVSRSLCDPQKSAIYWTGTAAVPISDESLVASAFLRHLYSNRDTVIRSNGRPNCFNGTGDVNALNMLTPPNSDTCKDQLHLNIPHISVQSKGQSSLYKDPVTSQDEFSMTPPSSVSPQEKITPPFPDAEPECLNMRFSHGTSNSHNTQPSKVQSFPATLLEHDSDLSKSHFPAMPSYACHGTDINHFTQFAGSGGGAGSGGTVFDSRPEAAHAMWFGSTYSS